MRLVFACLLVIVAAPLAAQPADSTRALSALSRWVRSDTTGGLGFNSLPLRSVREVAALLPGFTRDPGTSALAGRLHAGFGQEPTFVLDGFRVADPALVPFGSVERVVVLTGSVPARYGEAADGLVLVGTNEGGLDYDGRVEALTSEGLDAYGYNLAAFSVGGPLGPARVGRFFLAGEVARLGDASPYGSDYYRLTDEASAALQANPQVLRITNGVGEERFVPFPADLPTGTPASALLADPAAFGIEVPDGFEIVSGVPLLAAETLTEGSFERARAKEDPLRALALHGSVVLQPAAAMTLRVGGDVGRRRAERAASPLTRYARLPFAGDRLYEAEHDAYRLFTSFRHRLTATSSYHLGVDYQQRDFALYPDGFSSEIEDALFYADFQHPANESATRYVLLDPATGTYVPRGGDGFLGVGSAYGLFALPGAALTSYQRERGSTLQLTGAAEVALGVQRLTLGAEYEQQVRRAYRLDGSRLAFYHDDADGPEGAFEGMPEEGVDSYDDLPYEVFRPIATYYGYTFDGLGAADGQDVAAFGRGERFDVAPHRPIYFAGYAEDRIAYRDLTLALGLRVEVFDNNALVLYDPFAPYPILRAGALAGYGAFAERGIGEDYAVYFSNPNDASTVVGFRDREGSFFGLDGAPVTQEAIDAAGRVRETGDRTLVPEMFEGYAAEVTVMPRVSLELRISEGARLFGYYDRLARRPPPGIGFAPFSTYDRLEIGGTYGNPNLKPVVVDAFGLGAAFRPAEPVTLSAALFHRHSGNAIVLRNLGQIGAPEAYAYNTFLNRGMLTTYGVDLAAQTARVRGFAGRAGYTLAFAESADASADVSLFPTAYVSPSTDLRHALDLALDYRVVDGAGPFLGGFGLGATFSAQSGSPYSPTARPGDVRQTAFLPLVGGTDGARLPWTSQLDLRLDKRFAIGAGYLSAFLWVENVLGTENVLAVYRYTGQPDEDGFLNTPEGQASIEAALVPEAFAFQYRAFTGGPVNVGGDYGSDHSLFYGQPRQIRLGVRLGF